MPRASRRSAATWSSSCAYRYTPAPAILGLPPTHNRQPAHLCWGHVMASSIIKHEPHVQNTLARGEIFRPARSVSVQEFVELVRAEDLRGAIAYARQHLAQWAEAYEAEHQRACALLAFRSDPSHPPHTAHHHAHVSAELNAVGTGDTETLLAEWVCERAAAVSRGARGTRGCWSRPAGTPWCSCSTRTCSGCTACRRCPCSASTCRRGAPCCQKLCCPCLTSGSQCSSRNSCSLPCPAQWNSVGKTVSFANQATIGLKVFQRTP